MRCEREGREQYRDWWRQSSRKTAVQTYNCANMVAEHGSSDGTALKIGGGHEARPEEAEKEEIEANEESERRRERGCETQRRRVGPVSTIGGCEGVELAEEVSKYSEET